MIHLKKTFFLFALLFIFSLISSCTKKQASKHLHSFYFWKTRIGIDSTEAKILNGMDVKHLYIKYFDVKWSPTIQKTVPVGVSEIYSSFELTLQNYTPCVFLTNDIFLYAPDAEVNELAEKLVNKINSIDKDIASLMSNFKVYRSVDYKKGSWDSIEKVQAIVKAQELKRIDASKDEIQIDCDWTVKTKDRYFAFLKQMKALIGNRKLSCTLRLWQYKNQSLAGVPPVDRCLLMCYSMANPKKVDLENSIASLDQLKTYISGKKYPLKLDVALPIYSWAILFRQGQFKGILGSADEKDFIANKNFYLSLGKHRYQIKRDTVVADSYLRYGDEIRVEQVNSDELEKMASLLTDKLSLDATSKISFFSWDTVYVKQYGAQNIKKIYSLFDQ